MKFKLICAAAMTALLFASCSKENDAENPTDNGGEATLKLSITMPVVTRATENATAEESQINDIHLYVFNADGTTPADANDGYFQFNLSHFTQQGTSLTYNLKDAVTTTAGTKTIYVGINLTTASLGGKYANETAFLAKTAAVRTQLMQYSGATLNGITMFGVESGKQLIPAIDGSNAVNIGIDRNVARVITTAANGTVQKTWKTANDMTFQITKYFVTQDAHTSFVAPNFYNSGNAKTLIDGKAESTWGTILNLYDPSTLTGATVPYVAIVSDPTTGRANMEGFYIGENASYNPYDVARHGNTAYAFIQTKMSITATAKVNGANTDIEYSGGAIVAGTDDLYIVRVMGIADYICDYDNYTPVADFLTNTLPEEDVTVYKYPKGYVYYRVFLNRTEAGMNKYNVYRNQFIHIDVTGVNVDINRPGGFGYGYPGEETDPEVPTDPFSPDPNNPDPHEPTDPIDETEATLQVNITVRPWEYTINSTVLE